MSNIIPLRARAAQHQPPTRGVLAAGEVTLAYTAWGDKRQPVIVLVHGYPDNSEVWHPLAQYLAREFHVIAYDVRGAGRSSKPEGRKAYKLDLLLHDFVAVVDHLCPGRAVHVVAHDWGSVQCWEAVTEPALKGRIASFTSCSGPCLDHVGHWMRDRIRQPSLRRLGQVLGQSLRSWYVYFFQIPLLPEMLWRTVAGRWWHKVMQVLEGVTVARRAGQASDGAYGVGLYRANMLQRIWAPRERFAHAPVQLLVPLRDRFVGADLHEDLARWVGVLWRREFDAGHWMPLTHPRDMAGAVRRFVRFVEKQPARAKR